MARGWSAQRIAAGIEAQRVARSEDGLEVGGRAIVQVGRGQP